MTPSQSANDGPLGSVADGRVRRHAVGRGVGSCRRIPESAVEPIDLVTHVVGQDGRPLRLALAGGARGVVIAAPGAGNTHPDLLAAAEEGMAAGIPMVLTTRSPHGRASATYAFPGGGARWLAAGAILAGPLGGPKARIALALGLGAGLDACRTARPLRAMTPATGPHRPRSHREPGGRGGVRMAGRPRGPRGAHHRRRTSPRHRRPGWCRHADDGAGAGPGRPAIGDRCPPSPRRRGAGSRRGRSGGLGDAREWHSSA